MARTPDSVVRQVRERFAAGESAPALAREFGLHHMTVFFWIRGRTRRSAGGPVRDKRPAAGPKRDEILRRLALGDSPARIFREIDASEGYVYEVAALARRNST